MVELKGLEDWARGILATSKTELNRRYGTWKRSDEFSKSIEALPFYTRYRPVFRTISEPTLLALHQKLRGQRCEERFWSLVLIHLDNPLPDGIALDLMARYSVGSHLVMSLGHTRHSDKVMWKLAPFVDEALLTLAKEFYTVPERTLGELETALRRYPDHEWMLESLAHCAASSPEKRLAFEKAIEGHPRREKMLETNPQINPTQRRRRSWFDLENLPESQWISALYDGYDFEKFITTARDDEAPDVILHELELLREFPGATQIRAAARHTLRRREEMNEQWANFLDSNNSEK